MDLRPILSFEDEIFSNSPPTPVLTSPQTILLNRKDGLIRNLRSSLQTEKLQISFLENDLKQKEDELTKKEFVINKLKKEISDLSSVKNELEMLEGLQQQITNKEQELSRLKEKLKEQDYLKSTIQNLEEENEKLYSNVHKMKIQMNVLEEKDVLKSKFGELYNIKKEENLQLLEQLKEDEVRIKELEETNLTNKQKLEYLHEMYQDKIGFLEERLNQKVSNESFGEVLSEACVEKQIVELRNFIDELKEDFSGKKAAAEEKFLCLEIEKDSLECKLTAQNEQFEAVRSQLKEEISKKKDCIVLLSAEKNALTEDLEEYKTKLTVSDEKINEMRQVLENICITKDGLEVMNLALISQLGETSEAFESISEKKSTLESNLLHKEQEISDLRTSSENIIATLKADLESETSKVKEMFRTIQKMRSLVNVLYEDKQRLKSDVEAMEHETINVINTTRGWLKTFEDTCVRLQAENASLAQELDDSNNLIKKLQDDVLEKCSNIDELILRKTEVEEEKENIMNQLTMEKKDMESLQSDYAEVVQMKNSLEMLVKSKEESISHLNLEREALNARVDLLEDNVSNAEKERKNSDENLQSCMELIEKKDEEIEELLEKLRDTKKEMDEIISNTESSRLEVNAVIEDIADSMLTLQIKLDSVERQQEVEHKEAIRMKNSLENLVETKEQCISQLLSEKEALNARMNLLEGSISNAEKEKSRCDKELNCCMEMLKSKNEEIQGLSQTLCNTKKEMDEIIGNTEYSRAEVNTFVEDIKKSMLSLQTKLNVVEQQQEKAKVLQETVRLLKSKNDSLKDEIKNMAEISEENNAILKENADELSVMTSKQQSMQAVLEEYERKLSNYEWVQSENEELKRSMKDMLENLESKTNQLDKMQTEFTTVCKREEKFRSKLSSYEKYADSLIYTLTSFREYEIQGLKEFIVQVKNDIQRLQTPSINCENEAEHLSYGVVKVENETLLRNENVRPIVTDTKLQQSVFELDAVKNQLTTILSEQARLKALCKEKNACLQKKEYEMERVNADLQLIEAQKSHLNDQLSMLSTQMNEIAMENELLKEEKNEIEAKHTAELSMFSRRMNEVSQQQKLSFSNEKRKLAMEYSLQYDTKFQMLQEKLNKTEYLRAENHNLNVELLNLQKKEESALRRNHDLESLVVELKKQTELLSHQLTLKEKQNQEALRQNISNQIMNSEVPIKFEPYLSSTKYDQDGVSQLHLDQGMVNSIHQFRKVSGNDFPDTSDSKMSPPRFRANYLICEDEEGEEMNHSSVADRPFTTRNPNNSWRRLSELQRRNTLCLPHLKTSYPIETQMCNTKTISEATLKTTENESTNNIPDLRADKTKIVRKPLSSKQLHELENSDRRMEKLNENPDSLNPVELLNGKQGSRGIKTPSSLKRLLKSRMSTKYNINQVFIIILLFSFGLKFL